MIGAQSTRRKIKRFPDHIKRGVQDAVRDSVDTLHAEALVRVPVDEGDLAKALHKKLSSDKLGGRVGYWKKGNIRNWRLAGWRAHFTEFGTRSYKAGETRYRSNSRTTSRIRRTIPARPAQPFLGPAFNASKRWIRRRMNRAINKALRRASSG